MYPKIVPTGFTTPLVLRMHALLAELRDDNLKLVESFRAVKEAAEEAKDNATSGIVDEWTDQAEERAWFLFEASRKGRG